MPRDEFRDRLDALREDALGMSDLVLDRYRMSLEALDTKDEGTARTVIEGDGEVNELYLDIEKECIDLIALQQPVASDLRLVAASFKIITDLERVADVATNLGEYTVDAERAIFPEVDVQELGAFAGSMLEDSMRAYENEDADLCHDIEESDDILDRRCEEASERIIHDLIDECRGAGEDKGADGVMGDATRLLLTVRDLERVGDHAVNIAARTLYMVETDDSLLW